ncbi:hypothetical protein KIW84_060277 [Lathyrus oleraceus]|uniref:Uncharacterized protein n=1 Tax=Pisum sativum TaxID=3888 RepID=A0A9D5A3M3_PEA|nr:hypothetical protein KIW84_060277 [Pisum sativum]
MDRNIEKGNGKTCDEEVNNLSESSDEFVEGVHFDDNEEDRMKWFDENVDCEPRTEPIVDNDDNCDDRSSVIRFIEEDSLKFNFKVVELSRQGKLLGKLQKVTIANNLASARYTFKVNIVYPAPGLQPRFERCYICFDGTKKALTKSCRPFIGLDGFHLKHKYGGILLIVVGRGPNYQYFLIALELLRMKQTCHVVGSLNFFLKTLEKTYGVSYLTSKR